MQLALPSEGYGPAANPTRRRVELFADWIEAQVYRLGCPLAQPEIVDRLDGAGLVQDSDDAWRLVGDTFGACRARRASLGQAYPFSIAGSSIELVDPNRLAYMFCLLASLPEQFKPLRTSYPASFRDVFETLVAASLRETLPGWKVMETGWSQMPVKEKGAIVQQIAEWAKGRFIDETVFPSANDAQIDVAVVREFSDGRSAFPVLLGQCATGVTDWRGKTIRPNIGRWRKAVQFSTQPVGVFAVPFALDDTSFKEASDESDGLVLDRIRICAELPQIQIEPLQTLLANWIGQATQLLPEAA